MKPRATGFLYLERTKTRHGRSVIYLRPPGKQRTRLREEFGTPEFAARYKALMAGQLPARKVRRYPFAGDILRSAERCVKSARKRSREFGREFTLTPKWALEQLECNNFHCPLSGVAFLPTHDSGSFRNPFAPSIDRLDPKGGYTPDNCRIIILALNIAISDWGEKVFETFAAGYLRKKKKQAPKRRNICRSEA